MLVLYKMQIKHTMDKKGYGLFSTCTYEKDEIIMKLDGYTTSYPTRESIYVGNGIHIDDPYGRFMNHSFTPTTKISGKNVIALTHLPIDTELTFNYNDSEINMACPFEVDGQIVSGKK